jgi:hypothetical protein
LYISGPLAKPSAGPKLGEMLLSLSTPVLIRYHFDYESAQI